jgi:hypothetical protein
VAPDVERVSVVVYGVYRRKVYCVLGYGRQSEAWRHWLVLRIGGRLEAVAIATSAFRQLRRGGVPLLHKPIHALRKAER